MSKSSQVPPTPYKDNHLTDEQKMEQVEKNFREILEAIGMDLRDDSIQDTPKRVAKMFVKELFTGLKAENFPKITVQDNKFKYNQMLIEINIEVKTVCVPGNQTVNVADSNKQYACQVREGDFLWTLNKKGIPVKTRVNKVIKSKSSHITTIKFKNGKVIRLTNDHPLKLKDKWIEAGDLEAGDKVEYVNPRTLNKNQHDLNVNKYLGYVLGAIASDGSIQDDRRVCLEVNDFYFAQKYQEALKRAFNIDVDIQPITKPSGFLGRDIDQFRVRFVSSQIAKRLLKMLKLPQGLGSKSKTKKFRMPDVIKYSEEVCLGFMEGYIDGDGSKNFGTRDDGSKWGKENTYKIISSNIEFLSELKQFFTGNSEIKVTGRSASEMYFNPSWIVRHGFRQEEYSLDLGESDFIEVEQIFTEKKEIPVYSFKCEEEPTFLINGFLSHNCEHHFQNIVGVAHIAYIPKDKVIGLSKLNRVTEYFCKRPQVQERLTEQVQKSLQEVLECDDVAVVIDARHYCVKMRGVEHSDCITRTSALGGSFLSDQNCRNEFFNSIPRMKA